MVEVGALLEIIEVPNEDVFGVVEIPGIPLLDAEEGEGAPNNPPPKADEVVFVPNNPHVELEDTLRDPNVVAPAAIEVGAPNSVLLTDEVLRVLADDGSAAPKSPPDDVVFGKDSTDAAVDTGVGATVTSGVTVDDITGFASNSPPPDENAVVVENKLV